MMTVRTALVTGASRGIGRAIAAQLLTDGFQCALVARDLTALNSTATELRQHTEQQLITLSCDVTDAAQVDAMLHDVRAQLGRVDVIVNCAGRSGGGITSQISDRDWLDVINTNLHSVFYVCRSALRDELIQRGGSIINIASTGGKQGVIHGAPYSASKHAVVGFSKALGLELARDKADITVNAVCPGFVETEMAETVRANYAKLWQVSAAEAKRRIEDRVPIGRYIEPAEVAALVAYLASPMARGITAQALNVCGGLGNY